MRTELLGGTSHLLQMRGLKLVQQWRAFGVYVAYFTDAWIETPTTAQPAAREVVASFTDAWIETTITKSLSLNSPVASFTDAWIETSVLEYNSNNATNKSHLLQMRGLKPLFKGAFERVFNVASFTGTTIYNIFCKKITGLKYLFVRK